MRSFWDRVRYAVSFELIGLAIVMSFAYYFTELPVSSFGITAILLSLLATIWNGIWSWGFDLYLTKKYHTTEKTFGQRLTYALGFEGGLIVTTVPVMAAVLNIGLIEALILEIGIITFFLFYAYVFNWGYDKVFPVAAPNTLPEKI